MLTWRMVLSRHMLGQEAVHQVGLSSFFLFVLFCSVFNLGPFRGTLIEKKNQKMLILRDTKKLSHSQWAACFISQFWLGARSVLSAKASSRGGFCGSLRQQREVGLSSMETNRSKRKRTNEPTTTTARQVVFKKLFVFTNFCISFF